MTTREQACNLVASNLPPSVGDAQLAALFSRFGAVSSVRVMVDVRTGLSRGFGFVLMADQAAADAAVAATGKFNIEVADGSSRKIPGTATPPDVSLVPASSPPAHETGAPIRGPPLLIGYAGAGARVPGTPTSTVYVRNLPRAVTAAQVRSFMAAAVPAHVAAAALAGGGRAALVTHVALHLPKPNATAPNAAAAGGMMDEQDQSVGVAGANGSSSGAAAANNGGAICPHGAATDSVRAHVTFATPECAVAAAVATNGVMFTLAAVEGEVDSPLHDPHQQTATRILVKVVDQDHVKTAANPRRAGRGAPGAGTGTATGRSQHQQQLVSLTPLGTSGDHSSSSQNAASHLSFVTAPAATPGPSAHFPVDLQQQLQLLQQQQQQLLLSGGFNGFGASSSLMGALPLGGTWSSSSAIMPTSKQQLQQQQPQLQQQQQGSPMDTQMLRVNNLAAPFVAPMVMPPAPAAAGTLTAAPSFPAMPYLTVLPPSSVAAQPFASPHTAAPLPLHQPQPQQHQQHQQHQQPPQYFSAPSTMQPTPISFAALQQLALSHQQVPMAPGVSAAGGANNNNNNNNNNNINIALGGATALQWQQQQQQQQVLQQQQQQQQAGYTLGYAGAQLPQPTMWPPASSLATMQPSANGGAPVVVYLSSMPPAPGSVVDSNGVAQFSQQRFQQGDQQQQQQQQQQRPVFYVLPQPIASAAQ